MPCRIRRAATTPHTLALFRERAEHELQELSDEQLVEYICAARQRGRPATMRVALGVLVYGYWDTLVARASLRLSQRADAEDVASRAIVSALRSAFEGTSVGELRNWLMRILERRIADFYREREGRPALSELPSEHSGDDEVWGDEPAEPFAGEMVSAVRALRRAFTDLSPEHREVVRLHVLGPCSAAEAAELVEGMTPDNVHQIASRFRRRFDELLAEGAPP